MAMPLAAHRRDIDGLRALAVLPVLLFHVGIPPFSGGFVGVDIFFVISGYLITSIIARELDEGRFNLATFYTRRIKRIFPALFVVMVCTVIAGSFILLPLDYRALGRSAVATTLFASNLLFARQSGYFGSAAEEAPLLHCWSLAVEEQYYILFPLLMVLMWRVRRWRLALLGAMTALSFIHAAMLTHTAPVMAFYHPLPRAWELLAGALLTMAPVSALRQRWMSEAAAALGIGLIGWAVLTFSSLTAFPGPHALFPVVGAMLLILAGRTGSLIGNALSTPLPVFIGRISYSLYLWHWPIIMFWTYRTDGDWHIAEQLMVVGLSFAAAWLSWRFVEEPFRRAAAFTPFRAFAFAGCMITAGCCAGMLLYVTGGFPTRVTPAVAALDAASNSMAYLPERCSGAKPVLRHALCAVGARKAEPPTFLLWGDSHAHAMKPAFDQAGRALGISGRIASYPACPTLLGMDRLDMPSSHDCSEFNRLVLAALKKMPSVDTVVLVSRWGLCANGKRLEGGTPCFLGRNEDDEKSLANDRILFRDGLTETVRTLRTMGKRVVILASIPEFRKNVPETLARALFYREPAELSLSLSDYLVRQRAVLAILQDLQQQYGAIILYPHEKLCQTGRCMAQIDGVPLYADDDHLSRQGSLMLSGLIYEGLQEGR